ncbi:MAG TPA: TatD family hydrolase [Chloroflexia bacterium]|jgi:TatD DNase family protein
MAEHVTHTAPLVDTHAHLDFPDYDADRDEIVSRARAAGLVATVSIGIEPGDWGKTTAIAEQYRDVHAALGIHPSSSDQTTDATLADLAAICSDPARKRIVALGETGLDYYREYVPHEVQRESFRAHLDLARQLDLPVIIHTRDAHADVLAILKRDGAGTRGVMHSFSGDISFAEECIMLGYMVSLAGPVTFRKAADKHQIAAWVPLDMLLVETDCPFLTPEPYRGRRNEPAYVAYTAQAIAKLRGISVEELAAATTANACKLFSIQPGEALAAAGGVDTASSHGAQQ